MQKEKTAGCIKYMQICTLQCGILWNGMMPQFMYIFEDSPFSSWYGGKECTHCHTVLP